MSDSCYEGDLVVFNVLFFIVALLHQMLWKCYQSIVNN